jgi:hypothetical protein
MAAHWSPRAEHIIKRLMVEAPPANDDWVRAQAERLTALPVFQDMGGCWFLHPIGEVVTTSEEGWPGEVVVVYTDRVKLLQALVGGLKRYPQLAELLPAREPEARDCPCRDHELFRSGKILCGSCGGVGWLPAQVEQ